MTTVLDYVERRPKRRRLPPVTLTRSRTYAEHVAFSGALMDLLGYLGHFPLTEGIGKAATIVACVALYIEHAEQKRIERRLDMP